VHLFLLPPGAAPAAPVGALLELPEDESRHLVKVLRIPPGERVRLADGRGVFLEGVIERRERRCVLVRVVASHQDDWERLGPRLVLACAVTKGKRFAATLEAAVELGVHAVHPLVTGHTVVDPGEGRRQHWQGVVDAAVKQAGRSWRPALAEPATLAACLAELAGTALFYGAASLRRRATGGDGDAGPGAPLPALSAPADLPASAPALVWLVGPEGGWTDDERRRLAAAGARPLWLGPHRLRTGTAALAGLAWLQQVRRRLLPASLDPSPAPRVD
jgi:16S rRNA (uracil1498-N3)-methyltransferase